MRTGKRQPLDIRFWEKVDKNGPVPYHCPELGRCWIWTAAQFGTKGYGAFKVGVGKQRRAHRVAWELVHGPVTEGKDILHRCDNRLCVRADHLFEGTPLINSHDMIKKGRGKPARGERHGANTHPEKRFHGSRGGGAPKLLDAQVRAIRVCYPFGNVSLQALATEYGVSVCCIQSVLARKTYRYVID